jgi:hypothetical protein
MMYSEFDKAAKIMVGLVREDFRLFRVSVLVTRRRFNDAQAASSSEDEEDAAAEQESANGRPRHPTATEQTKYTQTQMTQSAWN